MHIPTPSSQRGAALITGLIFLVVLTLITLSATKSTSLEERMAGNARDQDMAFQAAEAGLRDAIGYISTSGISPSSFGTACSAGLCPNDPVTPVWTTVTWVGSQTREYPGTLAQVAIKPRYIIELITSNVGGPGDDVDQGGTVTGTETISYRVTSRGWGQTPQTQATLQATINY